MRHMRALFSLMLLLWAGALLAQPLALSPTQQAWLKANPSLRVGVSREFPPYYFTPPEPQRPHGFVIGMIDLWGERLGLAVDIQRFENNDEAVRALLAGRVDMIPYALPQAGDALLTLPVLTGDQVLVARRDVPDISPNGNFGGYRVAAVEGSPAAALLASRFPETKVSLFAGPDQALLAVAGGKADFFVGYQQVAVYQVEKLLLANLVIRRNLGPGTVPIGPTVRRDAVMLRGVLTPAIDSVTAADRSALVARWLPAATLAAPSGEKAELTPAEQKWVERHGRIRVGFDADFSPITRDGELSDPQGLGIDYLRLVAHKTGLKIEREVGGPFAEVYAKGLAGELDVIVGLARSTQRRADYEFVGPFSRVPTAIVMRDDDRRMLTDTREFGVRKVALLKQHFLIPELMARHPGAQLLELDRQDQVLAAVAEGAADVALGNLKVVNELIERRYRGALRITGTVAGGDSELYFGVRRNDHELRLILRKGLDAVSDAESNEMAQRWLLVEVHNGLRWQKVLGWLGPVLLALLIGMALLWRSQRKMAQARAIEAEGRRMAEESAAARGRFLAYLSHELRGTLGAVASGAEMAKTHTDAAFQASLLDAMADSMHGLGRVLETTLSFEQNLAKPIQLQPQEHSLSALWTSMVAPGELAAQRKGITFDARCETGDETVLVDGARLQQVLSNLLHNAVKFTAKGVVQVRARWVAETQAVASGERQLEIAVSDNGPGMSAQEIERIFEPYAQGAAGERLRQGAGLGLAIARQIVSAMRGTLAAHSTPGQGATFVLRVPLQVKR